MKLQARRVVKKVRGERSVPPVNGDRAVTDSTISHHARIAVRAYAIYEQRGRQDGQDVDDWLAAEHLVNHDPDPGTSA
ncbi:MAG: hypothetical protein NTNFB02_16680 [Nitrospira sp.]